MVAGENRSYLLHAGNMFAPAVPIRRLVPSREAGESVKHIHRRGAGRDKELENDEEVDEKKEFWCWRLYSRPCQNALRL